MKIQSHSSSVSTPSKGAMKRRDSRLTRPHRNVHFDSFVTVVEIEMITDKQEIDSLWYNADEQMMMKKSSAKDVQKNKKLQNYCIDSEAYEEHRRQQREETISNVLLQQELLWDDGIEDPEVIAEVYMEDTGTSQQEATKRGIRHASFDGLPTGRRFASRHGLFPSNRPLW